ncbi:MAG: septum formation initiator family protein [Patescibacteria group bacterium]
MQPQRNKIQAFFYSKNFIFACVILICLMTFALSKEYSRQSRVNEKIGELKQEVNNLEESNFELAHLIGYLKSDEYVELEARKTLGYKKPGEKVVVIKNINGDSQVKGVQTNKNQSNPKKWFSYFFKF